ncbi:MAG: hypothetical protein NVS3B26_13090 [Mycobacteriales bacterium]
MATDDDDDVQLPDLQVIQRYSLAVRGATARRADVVAALEADLAWLTGGRGRAPGRTLAAVSTPPAVAPAAQKNAAERRPGTKATASGAPRTTSPAEQRASSRGAATTNAGNNSPGQKAAVKAARPVKAPARSAAASTSPAKKAASQGKAPAKRVPVKTKPGARRR